MPLQITYRNVPVSRSLELEVGRRVQKLMRRYPRVTGCHVTVEAPNDRHLRGNPYQVRVAFSLPGTILVAGNSPIPGDNVYLATREAFRVATRELHDHIERQRSRFRSAA